MKKFKFSLESVLKIELQLEQMIDIRLAKARSALNLEIERYKQMQAEVEACQNHLRSNSSAFQPAEAWSSYQGRMNHQLQLQQNEINQRQSGFNNILREKIRHTQRIEGLRNLESSEAQKHQREEAQQEQKMLLGMLIQDRS